MIFVVATIGDNSFFDEGWHILGEIYSPIVDKNPLDNKKYFSEPKLDSLPSNYLNIETIQELNFAELEIVYKMYFKTSLDKYHIPDEESSSISVDKETLDTAGIEIWIVNNGISEAKNPFVRIQLPADITLYSSYCELNSSESLILIEDQSYLCNIPTIPSKDHTVLYSIADNEKNKEDLKPWLIEALVTSSTLDPIMINNEKEFTVNFK